MAVTVGQQTTLEIVKWGHLEKGFPQRFELSLCHAELGKNRVPLHFQAAGIVI